MAMFGMNQQQPMFGQRPQPSQTPQMGSDPFVQAWMAQAQQAPQAPQMQQPQKPQAAPQTPVMPAGQGAANDPLAPVTVTPQVGSASGGGIDWAKLLQMFVGAGG